MRVLTVLGTRPEIIRLSRIIGLLDEHCEHTLVHTGQNHDPRLSDVFFDELGVRPPDIHLGIRAIDFAGQAGQIIARTGEELARVRPDRVLILGDTDSGLAALPAARAGIPVFHMEAGNRCHDDRVPEEINRRVIDQCSTVLLPYTKRSAENLLREGFERERIVVTGNPIWEVLRHYEMQIGNCDALAKHRVEPNGYLLATLHRAENVDEPARLSSLLEGLSRAADLCSVPLLLSVHPRTASRMAAHSLRPSSARVRLLEPLGFFDFVRLEKDARAVLTDSGTVQEECAIFGVPNVTLRDVTERPETLECGSNVLSGADPARIIGALELALSLRGGWSPPPEYLAPCVSRTVIKVVLGHLSLDLRRHKGPAL